MAWVLCPAAIVWAGGVSSGQAAVPHAAPPPQLFPADGARGVCPDTPLRLTFAAPPTIGSGGKIQIVDAADGRVVETIDVGAPTATQSIGGLPGFKYRPVIVAGTELTIHPRNGALAYGKTYDIRIDANVLRDDPAGTQVSGPRAAWRFTTKAAPPPANGRKLIVAADGTGDFATVQGAFDFIPDGNTVPTTIFVRRGTYTEIVFFTNKHAITLMGEDRARTLLTYTNNDRFNHSDGNPYAVDGANPSDAVISRGDAIYRRAVFMAHRANELVVANLTIRNATPSGGSQAEAIILNGTASARAIIKDVNLVSTQDTLQINGQAYVTNCTIEGDVDFMWGQGPCFFVRCTCLSIRSHGFYTQIRNPGTHHGFIYVKCKFATAPGTVDNYLSRIKPARFPDSEVVIIDSVFGPGMHPVLWELQGGGNGADAGAPTAPPRVHFWEHNSRSESGKPVAVDVRLAVSRQLERPRDALLISNYSDPRYVLGDNWDPRTAAIFGARSSR